jgi:hypothetical protein
MIPRSMDGPKNRPVKRRYLPGPWQGSLGFYVVSDGWAIGNGSGRPAEGGLPGLGYPAPGGHQHDSKVTRTELVSNGRLTTCSAACLL